MKLFTYLLLFVTPWLGAQETAIKVSGKDRYAADIAKFVEQDKAAPPPQNALLISGSSSARFWVSAHEDFKPYPVINRGFGGSKSTDVLSTMDQIALPYHPRLVIYFAGTNDLGGGSSAEAVVENIRQYVERIRKENPKTGIVIMAGLKSPKRKTHWAEFDKFNDLLQKYCAAGKNLAFVDHNKVMNNAKGEAIASYYREEGDNAMHANAAGYAEIVKLVRPVVDKAWAASDPAGK
ncbi:MAG: GDSL-type esterase/lipase family protein [Opitutae bacterium]